MIYLIVAGGGKAFYKNLFPALQTDALKREMDVAMLIDVMPRDELNPATLAILNRRFIEYIQAPHDLSTTDFISRAAKSRKCAGIVMAPDGSRLAYANLFARSDMPVYIKEPAATSAEGLDEFLKLANRYPDKIYAAEHCTDGKCLGLLLAGGAISESDPRLPYLEIKPFIKLPALCKMFNDLGQLKHIRGTMLEGSGAAGTADRGRWPLDDAHGGMIRDLTSHLIGALYDLGMVSQDMEFDSVIMGKYEEGMPFGEYRLLARATEGETYAQMRGGFFALGGTIPFVFNVGKCWAKHERMLALDFENGAIRMSYEAPFETVITLGKSDTQRTASIMNYHPFHPALALMDFQEFIERKTDGHINRAAAIVRFNKEAREFGLRQLGLA